jgi:hypothetical protein
VVLSSVDALVAVGKTPGETVAGFADARQHPRPVVASDDLPMGEAMVWRPGSPEDPVRFLGVVPREERRRHRRKYAEGELPPDRSFYFRGPDRKLNLRAQNLKIFLQMAEGIDEATWRHHPRTATSPDGCGTRSRIRSSPGKWRRSPASV